MNTVMRWGRLAGVAGMMGCSVIPFPRLDGADAGAADAAVADTDGGTPDAGTQDAGPPVRTVRRGLTLFGKTPTNNLLMDPLVTGTFISSLSFTGLVESGGGYDGTFVVRTDSATPADTPAAVGVAFQSSDRVIIAAPFPGGQGPFRAEVWAPPTHASASLRMTSPARGEVGAGWDPASGEGGIPLSPPPLRGRSSARLAEPMGGGCVSAGRSRSQGRQACSQALQRAFITRLGHHKVAHDEVVHIRLGKALHRVLG
jgi:hypothetical protein